MKAIVSSSSQKAGSTRKTGARLTTYSEYKDSTGSLMEKIVAGSRCCLRLDHYEVKEIFAEWGQHIDNRLQIWPHYINEVTRQ